MSHHREGGKSYFFDVGKNIMHHMDWTGPLESRTTYCRGRGLYAALEGGPSRVPGWITSRCHTQVLPELPRDPWSSDFSLNIALWKNYAGQMSEKRGWKGWKLHQKNGWTRWKQNRQDGNREELTSEQSTEISAYKEGTLLLNPL